MASEGGERARPSLRGRDAKIGEKPGPPTSLTSSSRTMLTPSQTRDEAKKHYSEKADFVQKNLETLQKTIERKQENVQSVVQVLQMKLQEAQGGAKA